MKELNINEDFEFDFLITRRNPTTRVKEPATGLSGVTGRLALTKTGAALGGTSTSLTEAGTTGRYVGPVDTATLVAALTAYVGQVVYAIPSKSGDFDCRWQEYRVVDNGRMGS